MVMGNIALAFLLHDLLWFLLFGSSNTCYGAKTDIQCLKDLKDQLSDPDNNLSSWIFMDGTEDYICRFAGIGCWGDKDNKIRNIKLANMGLQGQFPSALKKCKSLNVLDLSGNNLSGPIPHDIDILVPYLLLLNLSSNGFSGEIPPSMANFTYLIAVNLAHNQLTGQIPWQLARLNQLYEFNVADNSLSGQIPYNFSRLPPQYFANNRGLIGMPLGPSRESPRKAHHSLVIIGSVAGGLVFAALIIAALVFCLFGASKTKVEDVEGSESVKALKETKGFNISMIEKSVPKMRLFNLKKATNNFSENNIIGSERNATMYKAVLPDGSLLAVKRLQESLHVDKYFISEITALASKRHWNLVPLAGFCIARKERLLIYKYMSKGTLYDQLHHVTSEAEVMDWVKRLRIAVGLARGLKWLHHHCDPCIIHRNIGSKSILLDENYEPKISGFGFAMLTNQEHSHPTVSLDASFYGSAYVAPEYKHTLVTSLKGDVYSFGMVLLELFSGKKPAKVAKAVQNVEDNMVNWITYLINLYAKDKSLIRRWCDGDIFKVLKVAFACIESASENRPTMLEVYRLLSEIGARYGFIGEDERLMPSYNNNSTSIPLNGLTAAQEIQEIQ